MVANTWQGEFPWENLLQNGYAGTSPVKSFPPNGFGLYDMAGSVPAPSPWRSRPRALP